MDYIEKTGQSHPDLVLPLARLGELYERKLYHQLTEEVVNFLKDPNHVGRLSYQDFYTGFLSKFEGKINQLRFAVAVGLIAKSLGSADEAQAFYESIQAKKERLGPEASLYLDTEVILLKLKKGDVADLEAALKAAKSALEGLTSAETIVHSSYYRAATEYHKVVGPPEAFYRNALMLLAYTPVESLSEDEKYGLAVDMSLAALTGDGVFNFGEVLATPLLAVLDNKPHAWLSDLLKAFDKGDVDRFAAIVEANRQAYLAQPALVNREEFIKEKVVLLSLMNLVFETPAHERTIPFGVIADRGRIQVPQVEWLVMRAMSLGLIKGIIDQVAQSVSVSWVQPRVLSVDQVQQLATRLQGWGEKVQQTLHYMEEHTPELFN